MVAAIDIPAPLPMTDEERDVLIPPPKLSVVEWAQQRRVLDRKTSAIHGPWSWGICPPMVEIAEAWCDPTVRWMVLKKCSQSAATELLQNILGRTADEDPAPTLLVMPVAKGVGRRIRTRVEPMFANCPSLLERLGGNLKNLNVGGETTLDNMLLYLGWATSPAALADNPVCYVLLDEVDKYPPRSGREADPISLAKDRQRTFPNAKTLMVSTPTDENSLIEREFLAGDRRDFWTPCPHCGTYQVMVWDAVEMDRDAAKHFLPPAAYENGEHARYRCVSCRKPWTEGQRWEAVCGGVWCPDGCTVGKDGRIRGRIPRTSVRSWSLPSWLLHPAFQTIKDLAADWARAMEDLRGGDAGPAINFRNSEEARIWKEVVVVTDATKLATHIDDGQAAEEVPSEAVVLTAGVDVQLDHFYIVVAAWAYLYECWIVEARRLDVGSTDNPLNWDPLADALSKVYPKAAGEEDYGSIALTMIDSGYRTYEAYDFCRRFVGGEAKPTKGQDIMPQRVRPSKIDYSPTTGRILKGSITLWHVNTTLYKNRAARLLTNETPGPGYLHLPADTTEDFLTQMTGEEKRPVRKGRGKPVELWVPKKGVEVHYWDAFLESLVAADQKRVFNLRPPGAPELQRRRPGGRRFARKPPPNRD